MPLSPEYSPEKCALKGRANETEEPICDDDLYCLRSVFVFFQVEKGMFHIPSYRLSGEWSPFFAKNFELPHHHSDANVSGLTRENPIVLPDSIRQEQFRNFLKFLYPLLPSAHLSLTKDEWISVLRLSTIWYFLKYRQIAISELQDAKALTSADKIRYGREFKIRSWVVEGSIELVTRDDTIRNKDVETINYDTSFALFRIREDRFRGQQGSFTPISAVQKALRDELDVIEHFEMEYKMDDVEIEPDVEDWCTPVFEPQLANEGTGRVPEPQLADEETGWGFNPQSVIASSSRTKKKR